MRTATVASAKPAKSELVAVFVPKGVRPELPAGAPPAASWQADWKNDASSKVLLRGQKGETWLLMRVPATKTCSSLSVRKAAGSARLQAESMERTGLTLDLSALLNGAKKVSEQEIAGWIHAATEGACMAGYDRAVLKKDRSKAKVKRVSVVASGSKQKAAVKAGGIAAAANLCAREVQNLPPNVLTPKAFAAQARKVANMSPKVRIKVLGEKQMRELKMGSLLGVSRGSRREAQLVHMTYKPGRTSKGRVAVVGKGLTFDSGGISLKPPGKMDEMKFDMSGAAAVLGLFHGLANGAACPYEVHGILGCVENMPGGDAQLPGDIVTAMNGKTIEVLNTDAEGRLVLADALTYAVRKIKPDRIYDLATLTGAVIMALGHQASGILGNNQKLMDEVRDAGERVDERCWQLPLWEEYRELTKGNYADLKNIFAGGEGAGTIAGGAFLSYFVDDCPWVHLDIAGTAWEGPGLSYMSAGGRGVGTRLFLELLSK